MRFKDAEYILGALLLSVAISVASGSAIFMAISDNPGDANFAIFAGAGAMLCLSLGCLFDAKTDQPSAKHGTDASMLKQIRRDLAKNGYGDLLNAKTEGVVIIDTQNKKISVQCGIFSIGFELQKIGGRWKLVAKLEDSDEWGVVPPDRILPLIQQTCARSVQFRRNLKPRSSEARWAEKSER
jgi:hypothetical protein